MLSFQPRIVVWTLSLILAVSALNYTNCITINNITGNDSLSCLENHVESTTPCKTLTFVLRNSSLNNTEVVLQGDHWINHTLTVSHVDSLTIRSSSGSRKSTISCRLPSTYNHTGSGLVFDSVSNLTIVNVIFEQCGTLQYSTTLRQNTSVKYRSAVYIINSTDIYFGESKFYRNIGTGLSLHDVDGYIEVANSDFRENMVPKSEEKVYFGGGSIYIEFTYCSPGYSQCDPNDNMHNTNSTYVIKNCIFEGNRATNYEITEQIHIVQFRVLARNQGNHGGNGGGINISLKGTCFGNDIKILNCHFYNNSGQYGGGIGAIYQDLSRENTLNISACTFNNNSASERGGGALQLGYVNRDVAYNKITVTDTIFTNNFAGWGGAADVFVSRSKIDVKNRLEFINCQLWGNSASIGAAMLLKPEARDSIFDGVVLTPLISNCNFTNNRVVNTAAFLNIANDGISRHVLESAAVDIESITITFSKYVSFHGNTGGAIVAKSAQINVIEDALVKFVNNTATNGAAISLLGFSVLELFSNSEIIFNSNQASKLGGALYATSPHQTEFIFSHKCFIFHSSAVDPNEWNTRLTFINNTARYGHAIYTDSLLPCAKHGGNVKTNLSSILRWNVLIFIPDIQQYTVATSPLAINFTLPAEIAPGQKVNLHVISKDDLDQPIPTGFQVFLESEGGSAKTSDYMSEDGYLQITGTPGTHFNLTLQSQNTRLVSVTQVSKLGECPLGFIFQNDTCVCSASTNNRYLDGVTECDITTFKASLQIGYWIGCTDNGYVITSYCPQEYCNYQNARNRHSVEIARTCDGQNTLCIKNRRGQLCGECDNGYTVYYHSENFQCGKCEYGAAGLVIYIVAELIPLVVLFAAIMIMKFKMTSGVMQSLLLFAQTISLLNHTPSFVQLNEASSMFLRIHSFLCGFLSFDFFHLDELSFCLWSGATVLDNLAFRYVTTLFAIVLLVVFILIVNCNSVETITVKRLKFWNEVKKIADKIKFFKNAVVHGITTFLIFSYTLYTVTSFQILSRLTLTGEGGVTRGSVVRLQGNVEYFGVDHLPYAIPAVLVLLFLSLPPPLLLISYPLLWRVKARVVRNIGTDNDKTLWAIRKLLPLIDSFQGVFRDNCRMFAGLLFLWRIILTAIFALSSNLTELFFLTEIALLSFFIIHAVARPYKRRLYNVIDIVMLGNLTVINLIQWYISVVFSSGNINITVAIAIKIILMYIPMVCMLVVMVYRVLRRFNVIPEVVHFAKSEEDESAVDNITYSTRKETLQERKGSCVDEDLFIRAAEVNNPPLILTGSEAGFELQSRGKTNTTTSTTVSTAS